MSSKKKRKSLLRRMLRPLKWLIPLIVIAALVVLSLRPKPIEVDVGEVIRGAMQLTVDDDGETRVRDRYSLSAPLSGRLQRIDLDPGDVVEKGDVVATIDPAASNPLDPRARAQAEAVARAADASVASAEIQVETRKVEVAQLEKAFQRNKLLHGKGNIADATFEEVEGAYLAAKHSLDAALTTVEIASFELEQAKAALLHFDGDEGAGNADELSFSIRAPIDGTVLRIHEKSGRMLQAGTSLLELGNPRDLEMRIDVLSQDAVRIKPGQIVIIEHWGGEGALSGSVRHVEPSAYTKISALGVDEQRVDVIADFGSQQKDGAALADGYRIEARIVIWESADTVQVPVGALFRDGKDWAVYRINGDSAQLTRLELGRNNGEVAEVLSGLDVGDQVILHPGDRIEAGTLIIPRS
jgi:HlyD family secretion protein